MYPSYIVGQGEVVHLADDDDGGPGCFEYWLVGQGRDILGHAGDVLLTINDGHLFCQFIAHAPGYPFGMQWHAARDDCHILL